MTKNSAARVFWTAEAKRRSVACIAVALLALPAVSGGRGVAANGAIAEHRQTVLVLPFDLYDYSLDRRPATVVPLHRWVAQLADQVAHDLRHGGSIRQFGGAKLVTALGKVREDYPHPTSCRACMISIARRAGAKLVVIGQVHKLSNLITYFDLEVDDVRTGDVLHVIHMRADGADTDAMWINIARNLAGRIRQVAAHAH